MPQHGRYFRALWLNLQICKNHDQTWVFIAITCARFSAVEKLGLRPPFNSSLGTWHMLMHERHILHSHTNTYLFST